jgi:hypothetical protein
MASIHTFTALQLRELLGEAGERLAARQQPQAHHQRRGDEQIDGDAGQRCQHQAGRPQQPMRMAVQEHGDQQAEADLRQHHRRHHRQRAEEALRLAGALQIQRAAERQRHQHEAPEQQHDGDVDAQRVAVGGGGRCVHRRAL